jgi:hypothetical protein
MMIRTPHLQDETLSDCYYAARRGDTLDPPSAEHLADCEACSHRFADLGAFLNSLSEHADADVNALFPAERLLEQQEKIARRIELVGRAARVITFPGRSGGPVAVAQQARTSVSRLAVRWVAAAAAAGLFVGVAASTVFNFGPRLDVLREGRRAGVSVTGRQTLTSANQARVSPDAVEHAVVDNDDMFMSDLESVLDRPHTSELVAFDALTPHVREIRDSAR